MYSTSLERRGISEAFHHWLETRDFLKSEFETRKIKNTHTHTPCTHTMHTWWVCVFAGSQRRESATDRQLKENTSDQSLTFNDPLWPMQWELVGVIVHVCLCVFMGLIWKLPLSPLSSCPHGEGCSSDRHKSGRLSCVTGGRETEDGGMYADYGEGKRGRERRWKRLSVLNWDRCLGLMRLGATLTHKLQQDNKLIPSAESCSHDQYVCEEQKQHILLKCRYIYKKKYCTALAQNINFSPDYSTVFTYLIFFTILIRIITQTSNQHVDQNELVHFERKPTPCFTLSVQISTSFLSDIFLRAVFE